MKVLCLTLVMTATAALAVPACAQNYSDPCKSDAGTGRGAAECAAQKLADADRRIATTFTELLTLLPAQVPVPSSRGQAQLAQDAWKKFREENCQFIAGANGGMDIWVQANAIDCELEETYKRQALLEQILKDKRLTQ
jgi:uncharacterized protein YecT (DUF1311 family)